MSKKGRPKRGRDERRSVGRVGIQSRHSFHASEVGTTDAGLDERGAAEGGRQVDIRDSGEDKSRDGESGRATGNQVRGYGHYAKHRQRSTQNAGTPDD